MEDQAPYRAAAAAPQAPRNLAAALAAWLRTQGFAASEQLRPPTYAAVSAHWVGPSGERFLFDYAWVAGPVPSASCWLKVAYPGQAPAETLFTAQRVRRLREARQLLTGCVRYQNARLLARPPVSVPRS